MSTWYCENCKRSINHYGVPNHRQAHKRRKDGPVVMTTWKYRYTYDYRDQEPAVQDQLDGSAK